jgi:hypothetical protein
VRTAVQVRSERWTAARASAAALAEEEVDEGVGTLAPLFAAAAAFFCAAFFLLASDTMAGRPVTSEAGREVAPARGCRRRRRKEGRMVSCRGGLWPSFQKRLVLRLVDTNCRLVLGFPLLLL